MVTKTGRDQFGYQPLRLNLPIGYVTFDPGHEAAMHTSNVLNTPLPFGLPPVIKKKTEGHKW